MFLHQEINLKDYGKTRGEQYLNLLNKNFDESWKIYCLTYQKNDLVEFINNMLTIGPLDLEQMIEVIKDKQVYYLAVKDNYKLFISINKDTLEIKALNSNTNIKKFDLDKKTYHNVGELKR